ncbi:protein NO VEIN domain-containing protein [Herbidospora sp. RD11066]
MTDEGNVRDLAGPASLIEAAFRDALWLPDADLLVTSPEELPMDVIRAADAIGLGAQDALAVIRDTWGKVDAETRLRVGNAGELALLDLLRASSDLPVRHVAETSDGYGYDIAVGDAHLEVKSTTRRGRLVIYLSRHEYETMRRDPGWILVIVRLSQDLQLTAVATLDRQWIEQTVPADQVHSGRWESVRFDVPVDAVTSGLPTLSPLLISSSDDLLKGRPSWSK